ncbi:hypothetical protein OEZ60_22075 [Defluviimonas sp. WL0024]|uniref:Uncharacterized protein n=1 Tax=Albidovulum salinarum TaxID=2984153 RepID=A0ABT2X9S4_9RHOB|nr:hypothetical protein [Defluviimonas sp. WL0024]MCU9850658.1 hypothetical protein [Defluviimonas sp. WL0024]
MRRGPDQWLSGRVWDDDDHKPRYTPAPENDPEVVLVNGHYSRRGTARHDPDTSPTTADVEAMRQRTLEAAKERQAYADANFAAALRLGAALKALRGEE